MLGNVWEWVNDWYDAKYYQGSPSQDPSGPTSGRHHVLRGGSYLNDLRFLRVSMRIGWYPGGENDVGFRCAREVDIP